MMRAPAPEPVQIPPGPNVAAFADIRAHSDFGESSVSPECRSSQTRTARPDSRHLLFDIVKMSNNDRGGAARRAVVLWRKKRFTTEAVR